MNKKGKGIGVMMPIIIMFFMVVVGFALTAFVLGNIKTTQITNSTEWNTTNSVSEGIGVFADLMPGAGVVIGVAFIIFILIAFISVLSRR